MVAKMAEIIREYGLRGGHGPGADAGLGVERIEVAGATATAGQQRLRADEVPAMAADSWT
jgi:hypothetical protein